MSCALVSGIWLAWYIGDEGVWVCVFDIFAGREICSNTHHETMNIIVSIYP